jgi:pyrroloquinoline-quinone synthase
LEVTVGINAIVKERHLLTHPFYVKWSQGKVTLETLQEYSKQYYHYEKALPGFLTAAMDHIDDENARAAVNEVFIDESSNPRPHAEMWLDFAAGLGVSEAEVKASTPSCQTKNLVETYTSLCNRGQEEAAQTKADGLIAHYGVDSTPALAFFKLHAVLDIQHAKALRGALVDSELGRESAHLALDAWWGMLDQFNH